MRSRKKQYTERINHPGRDGLIALIRQAAAQIDLVWGLALRDLRMSYKYTFLGIMWLFLRPLVLFSIFCIAFSGMGVFSSEQMSYPVFIMTGILLWTLYSEAVYRTTASLIANDYLIRRMYVPRLVFPLSSLLTVMIDFFAAIIVWVIALVVYGYSPVPAFDELFISAVLVVLFGFGCGCFLAGLSVRFRDVPLITPFLVQVMLFLTPVFYSSKILPLRYQALHMINPVAAGINALRSGIVTEATFISMLAWIIAVFVFIIGLQVFAWLQSDAGERI